MQAKPISFDEVNSALFYNKDSGLFYRKSSFHKSKIGKVTGSIKRSGYIVVQVNNVYYQAARVAWVLTNGCIDDDLVIDHIDRNPRNNRLSNLRMVTTEVNLNNKNTNLNEPTPRFYTKHKTGKFQVIYKGKYIGLFDDEQAAIAEVSKLQKESK